jgi:hypothetical protein
MKNRFASTFKSTFLNTTTTIALSLICLFPATNAQADENSAPPKFEVEVVVFETLALKGWTEEFWPDNLPIMDLNDEDVITPPRVRPQYNLLNDEVSKMTRRMGYNILFHQAWVVDALPEDQAKPIYISSLPDKDYKSRLEGTLLFYKSRYPHIEMNLELERKIPLVIRSDFAKNQNMQEDLLPEFWRFQLKESRKIKTGQIHYLDHPIFGALVEIKYLPNYKPDSEMIDPELPPATQPEKPSIHATDEDVPDNPNDTSTDPSEDQATPTDQ